LTYADRNDTHTSYLAGSKLQQTKRLNNIITYANDNSIVASIGDFIHCPKSNNGFALCFNLGIIRITILKGLSTFGFSCPMITREFNSTKGLNHRY
jgi:hypothetical protein